MQLQQALESGAFGGYGGGFGGGFGGGDFAALDAADIFRHCMSGAVGEVRNILTQGGYADTVYKNAYLWDVGPDWQFTRPADGTTVLNYVATWTDVIEPAADLVKVFYFSTRTPISPICRTPLFPISQNFNSFLGRWGSAIRIECGWGQRRGTCNCGWRCWGDTFRRADRRPCGRRCRCGRRTVAGGAPSSVAVGVSRPNRSVPIPRGWRRFPIPRGWRRAAIGVSRPNRSAPTPRGWRRAAIPRGWRRAAIWVSRPNRSVPIPRGWRRAPIGVSRPNIRTTRSAPTPRGWRRAYVDAIHTRWRRAHTALLGAGASAPSGGPAPAGGGGSTRASPGALRSASTRGTGLCIKARACCCLFVHMSGMHHHPT